MQLISTNILIPLLIIGLMSGCSTVQHKPSKPISFKQSKISHSKKNIINNAQAMLGVDYYYGGTSPKTGFDCSGLVYYAHKKQGIKLPRTTTGQLKSVKRIYKSSLKPGDLVFFAIDHRKVSHVGIYLGDNKFIHSPSTGKKVNITSMNTNYWRSRFVTGGRI
ncbi:MAG: C40 family peptidase [Gammaproteobacteria bacterium]